MTTLAATFQTANIGAGQPPRVLLQVAAAPAPVGPYLGNFTTTDDGWTGTAGTAVLNNTEGGTATGLTLRSAAGVTSTFSRTVTGLSVGVTYRFWTNAYRLSGSIALGVSGMTASAFTAPGALTSAPVSYDFVATATSHVIQVFIKAPAAGSIGEYRIDGPPRVTRVTGWAGTTILRTDVNGTAAVRLAPGQDTAGTSGSATMTVTDYEMALTGTVTYRVTDGAGATTAPVAVTPAATAVWISLPATGDPSAPAQGFFAPVTMVTAYEAGSDSNGTVHKIIGRAEPIANPGPLALRDGVFAAWCQDYAAAKALLDVLAFGDVAQLRQPTFPGMDMYFTTTGVAVRPEEPTGTQRWIATVTYQEVLAP